MKEKKQPSIDGRRFGWTIVAILSLLWLTGGTFWLESLWNAEGRYAQLAALFPGALPFVGWTLTFTLLVLWTGLIWSLRDQQAAPVPQLTPDEMLDLAPGQFEEHVALIFAHKGFQVRHRGKTGDHGVDLEVIPATGRLGIVQCKRYRSTVGEQVVRDLYGTMVHEGAAHAFLVTAGKISAAAERWATEKPMTLVDGDRLQELVREISH